MKGYGLADVDRKTPITPNTIFRIGSVTKSFTAVVVLQLHERGQLTLKDPVAKYFPGFPAEACIAHLLAHTAGVPDFISVENALKKPLEFTPGTRINYSNTGYQLLGQIVERSRAPPGKTTSARTSSSRWE